MIEILLTHALVFQAQGDQPQAFAELERALTLTEPEGYIRVFVDEGEAMRLLLSDLKVTTRAHPLHDYIDRILNFSRNQRKPFPNPKHLHCTQVQVSKIVNLKSSSL